ncbi:hypothetical protein SYNTR_1266 [Candidatus Syntrophocurvum alkaliphilum]|uniref:Nif11 domain-containing protein n=1 Tax=Candidatus Syntrophocurvum alkaliphilum TaxID=2293317 RepID=A0A6I6DC78_9FIRM|nr:Nif11-like leader peptide family RiPP precursor [Candidatus Syntrophocurvum alkaliphilum]QGT99859.1 hypothetical protein SYNTR_1266 [Candidatus Syntrophocurvum alkaliphilum]
MEEKLRLLQVKCEGDQDFADKLFSFEKSEEVQSYLSENGMDFSIEEINELKDVINMSYEMGEISDNDLENVAGGGPVASYLITVAAADIISGGRISSSFKQSAKKVGRALTSW